MGRSGLVTALTAAAMLAGCTHLGLNPFPDVPPGQYQHRPSGPWNPEPSRMEKKAPAEPEKKPAGSVGVAAPEPPPPPPPPPPARLALKFEKGAKGSRIVTADTLFSLVAMQMNVKAKSESEFSHEVVDVRDDGSGVLSFSLVGLKVDSDNPMTGPMKLDTRDPESVKRLNSNPMMAQQLAPVLAAVGKASSVVLSPAGCTPADKSPGGASDGLSASIAGGSLGTLFTGVMGGFPQEAVAAGLTWKFHDKGSGPMGAVTIDGTARVSSWDEAGKVASIGFEGTVSIQPPENPDPSDMQAQFMAMTKLKSGELKGEAVFDQGNGRLVSGRSKMRIVADNAMAGGELILEVNSETKLVQ
jgi:hypothetical protein